MLVVTALLERSRKTNPTKSTVPSARRPQACRIHRTQREHIPAEAGLFSVSETVSPAAAGYCSFMINQDVLINQT